MDDKSGNGTGINLKSADVNVPLSEKLSYGMGAAGIMIMKSIYNGYMNFYWTDVLMIPMATVGIFLMVNKVWDAINDPIIGWLADRTTTKMGRYRPWIFCFIPMIVTFYFLFFKVPGGNMSAQMAFTFIMYFLFILFDTGLEVPHASMMAGLTTNYNARGVLGAFRQASGSVMMVVMAAVFLPLVLKVGDGDQAKGLPPVLLIFLLISVPLYLICIFGTKERVVPPVDKTQKVNFFAALGVLKGNKPAIMLALAYFCWGFQGGVSAGGRMYYFRYVAENLDHFAQNMTLLSLGSLSASLVLGFLIRKTKNKRTYAMFAWLLGGILYIAMWFVDASTESGMRLFDVLTYFQMLCAGMGMVSVFTLVSDVTEYTQKLHGQRSSGLIFAVVNFFNKLGTAFAQGIFSAVLGAAGYVAAAAQAPQVLTLIRASITIWPGILLLIGVVCFYNFKLNRDTHNATVEELSNKD
jgi:sugar (glycoside-pentoside-hexuronide) transporter